MKNKVSKTVSFIDVIQEHFRQKSRFWTLMSFISLATVIVLEVFLILQSETNPDVRQGVDSILVPMLGLFVLSTFWRGSIPTFLSLAGAMSVYGGTYYVYAKAVHVIHKYPEAKVLENINLDSIGMFYFLVGMLSLLLSLAIGLKPSFFRAKGAQYRQPYPVWDSDDYLGSPSSLNSGQMVPVNGLLSVTERYVATKYKYIIMVIEGKTYFVSPYDWVPEGSIVVRDKESRSLLGVPEVSDGFNVW